MADQVHSLWPEVIRPNISSPSAILHVQAAGLSAQTKGILLGEVGKRADDDGKQITWTFDIVVPILNGYRHRILTVSHGKDMAYPAFVNAEIFRTGSIGSYLSASRAISQLLEGGPKTKFPNQADSDQQLMELLKRVLESSEIISTAQSLIALANDALAEKERESSPDRSQILDEVEEGLSEDHPS
jgi:hypothetical protein